MRSRPLRSLAPVLLAASAAFALAGPAFAQSIPIDVEAGYRFLNVSGNEDMYRSQINEREGFLLRSLSISAAEPGGLFDRLTFDATDIGVGPAGGFRLELGKSSLYRLRATYSRTELFSALPAFANPLVGSGIIPGQHTYDRTRNRFDADIEIFPGGVITPLVGYSRNSYSGPGTTTVTLGADEFRLTQSLSDLDEEARVGASFAAGGWSGQVVQGWRKFRSEESLSLASGAGSGNNSGPVLGVPIVATGYTRSTSTEVDTPTTSAFVTGRIGDRVRLVGSYIYAKGDSDTQSQESAAGDFASFEISRFFHGLTDSVTSNADAKQWNGFGRVEFAITDGIDAEASYTRRHRELDGFALISDVFLSTSTFGGFTTGDITRLLQANTSLERTDEVFGASVNARRLGPVAIRGGYYRTNEDVTVTEDPSEIIVPGGQGGDFSRHIDSWNIGLTWTAAGPMGAFTLGGEYRGDRAGNPVVRTDFRDRDRYRARVSWGWKELVRVSGTFDQSDVSNDDAGISLHGRVRTYGGDLDFTPIKPFHIRFSGFKYDADNSSLIRQPQDFVVVTSKHLEEGVGYEGSIGLTIAPIDFQAAYGWFDNDGSFPFRINRVRMRAEIPITAHFSGIGEYARDDYTERSITQPNLGNFTADRFGLYVRWHL